MNLILLKFALDLIFIRFLLKKKHAPFFTLEIYNLFLILNELLFYYTYFFFVLFNNKLKKKQNLRLHFEKCTQTSNILPLLLFFKSKKKWGTYYMFCVSFQLKTWYIVSKYLLINRFETIENDIQLTFAFSFCLFLFLIYQSPSTETLLQT